MDFPWTPMFRTAARLDQSGGRPPWGLLLYNPDAQAWEPIGSPARGVLYESSRRGSEFVLTSEGNVIGVDE